MIKHVFNENNIISCIDSDVKVHQNSNVQE